MDKPTEHQPLDDLFRRKLTQASVQPGTESWARLNSRLTGQPLDVADKPTRRIGAVWYWSASAAAACLLLAFLWGSWNGQAAKTNTGKELAVSEQSTKEQKQPIGNHAVTLPVEIRSEVAKMSVTQPKTGDSSKKAVESVDQDRVYARRAEVEKTEGLNRQNQPIQLVKATDKQPEPTPNKPEVPQKHELASVNPQSNPVKAALPNPERTLIVSVAEPASEPTLPTINEDQPAKAAVDQAPVKNARIARVFRQIKRLKDGEVLARADVNSNETDEESGLFNRLVQATRSKENQNKQQK